MRTAAKAIVLLVTLAFGALVTELGLRVVDGYRLTTLRLVPKVPVTDGPPPMTIWPTEGADAIAAPFLPAIPVPAGVDRGWFASEPPPIPAKPARPDLDALSDGIADQTQGKFARRLWNLNFVQGQARRRQSYWEYLKQVKTPLHVFDPADHSEHPRYRLFPNDPHAEAWPTGTMSTNNLGYRGRDVIPAKPAKTIRIVFVGASTTIDHPSFPFSFPDFVGHYLNLWAKSRGLDVEFEVINAAREGFWSTDLAAVVDQELLALAPDIVVYKEGANQFGEAKRMLTVSDSAVRPITPDFIARGVIGGKAENYHSNLRRRLDLFAARYRPLGEAPRPPYTVNWPAGVDEQSPDLTRADLPLDLPVILRDLAHIQASLKGIGSDLAVSSFLWMARDGLRLVPGRANERGIYWYLNGNEVLWPLSYGDIRRFADFQNRVFQKFSQVNGAHFVDLARWFPHDPAFFTDSVHLSYAGVKMHGWVSFLELLPLVEKRLAASATSTASSDWPAPVFSTTSVAEVQAQLSEHALPLPLPNLDQWRPASAAVQVAMTGGGLAVTGGGARWSYQVMGPVMPVEPDTYYRVAIPTTVTSGVIGVGVLDQTGQTWISSPLDASPFTFFSGKNTTVQLVIADATITLGTLKPSVFTIGPAR